MNLVFIHGRAQGDRSEQEIRDSWTDAMKQGFVQAGVQPQAQYQILAPFYGKILDDLTTAARNDLRRVIERGEGEDEVPFDPFAASIVQHIAKRAGVTRKQAMDEADLTVYERGPERWEWVQALLRAAEKRAPWLANWSIATYTADVKAYLTSPYIRTQIHNLVLPALTQGPSVVVAHSLGSIVAYWALTEAANPNVPLLITAGSPLGINVIKDLLPHPLRIPVGVGHWLNVSDDRDLVALYARLDRTTFTDGIENVSDLQNGADDPHDIGQYLRDTTVARRLAGALS